MTLRAGVRTTTSLTIAVVSLLCITAAHAQTASVVPVDPPVTVPVPPPGEVAEEVAEPLEAPPRVAEVVEELAEPAPELPASELPAPTTGVPEAVVSGPTAPPRARFPTARSRASSPGPPADRLIRRRRTHRRGSSDLAAVAGGGDEVEATRVLGRELTSGGMLALTGYDLRLWLLVALLLIGSGGLLVARSPGGAKWSGRR